MIYPQIRIKNSWLLYENASIPLHKLWGGKRRLASLKNVDKKVTAYQKAWRPYEKAIMEGMQKITGLKFKHNMIDVYIAPWFKAFSDPMVIGIMYEPDYFVDILTHELLHLLLIDNTKTGQIDLLTKWRKLFGKHHSFGTLVHIPVHAVHKAIFLDILKQPYRLEREVARAKEYDARDYIKSWNYVERNNYKKLIKQMTAVYK